MAVDDAGEVGVGGQGAEGLAPVAGEAGGAEGVGRGLVAVTHQERCLQGEGHALDHAAGASLDRLHVAGELVLERLGVRGEARLAYGALLHLGEEGFQGGWALDRGSGDVEALDVAGALPDRVEGALAEEAGASGPPSGPVCAGGPPRPPARRPRAR